MGRYSIAVDFDGVIHSYTTPWVAAHVIPDPPVEGAIRWLDEMAQKFDIVIFTTRAKTWRGRRAVRRWLYEEAYYLHEYDIKITAKKPPCLIYLDDRAYRFEGPGTFPSAKQIHAARPWNKPRPNSSTS